MVGCGSFEERSEDGLRVLETTERSNASGYRKLKLKLEEGDDRLLLTGKVDAPHRVYVRWMEAPDGERVYDAEELWDDVYQATGAIAPDWATTLGWPVLPDDRALEPGTWTVELGTIDVESYFVSGVDIDVSVVFASGESPTSGELHVNLLSGGAVAGDAHYQEAIAGAVDEWRRLYEQVDITLDITEGSIPEGELFAPGEGDRDAWEALSADTPLRSINVVLLETMTDGELLYGRAGSVPSPLVPSINSGMAVNLSVSAGTDGRFQPDEVRTLGETFAHEAAHYLGAFHAIELDYLTQDSLSDTPSCTTANECRAVLGDNLMYPETICDGSVCEPQDVLTNEQGIVLRNYAGVW